MVGSGPWNFLFVYFYNSKNSSPLPDCTGNEVFFTNYSACVHIIYNPLFWCTKKIPLAKGEPPWVYSLERLYSILYLFTLGRGVGGDGEGELTREKVRGAIAHKTGTKITTRLTLSPVYKLY
jgi:hypothetical protein